MIKPFSFTGAKKIVFGRGSFSTLPVHLRELGGRKPLVVMDGNLSACGCGEDVTKVLGDAGIGFVLFDKVKPEPELKLAEEATKVALEKKCDSVVGIGGGSALDCAKAVSVLAANKGKAADYLGLDKVPGPGLPKVMVPTTAGTGSEVTFTAVFVRKDLQKKEGMNSPYLYPDIALLDPMLTLSLPPEPTATTGLDALCHAVESYTSVNASPMSEMVSLQAIRLIAENLRVCVHNGLDVDAREAMLLGSLYAGLGLANAGVTAVHSLSYPLGGRFGIPHGLANTLMLLPVMEFNLPATLEKFAVIAGAMGEAVKGLSVRDAAYLALEAVESLVEDCGIELGLEARGIAEEDLPGLADAALTVTRPLENNPRRVTWEDAVELYKRAF